MIEWISRSLIRRYKALRDPFEFDRPRLGEVRQERAVAARLYERQGFVSVATQTAPAAVTPRRPIRKGRLP